MQPNSTVAHSFGPTHFKGASFGNGANAPKAGLAQIDEDNTKGFAGYMKTLNTIHSDLDNMKNLASLYASNNAFKQAVDHSIITGPEQVISN